jgi:hypothetical protein
MVVVVVRFSFFVERNWYICKYIFEGLSAAFSRTTEIVEKKKNKGNFSKISRVCNE